MTCLCLLIVALFNRFCSCIFNSWPNPLLCMWLKQMLHDRIIRPGYSFLSALPNHSFSLEIMSLNKEKSMKYDINLQKIKKDFSFRCSSLWENCLIIFELFVHERLRTEKWYFYYPSLWWCHILFMRTLLKTTSFSALLFQFPLLL